MFRISLLATVVAGTWFIHSAASASAQLEAGGLRVVSYNVRYNNPRDGQDAWPHRAKTVARFLDDKADIAGLQEVLHGQLEDLKRELPAFTALGVARDDGKMSGEYSPILYRKKELTLLESNTFWLSESPGTAGSRSWDAALPRIVTWAKFKHRKTGKVFGIWNTHFDHRGVQARANSARLIRAQVVRIGEGLPTILTGDLNCQVDSEPIKMLTSTAFPRPFADAFQETQASHEGPDSSWNGFREVVPGRRIDFIMVTSDVKVLTHSILDPRTPDNRFGSDHLPVHATILP